MGEYAELLIHSYYFPILLYLLGVFISMPFIWVLELGKDHSRWGNIIGFSIFSWATVALLLLLCIVAGIMVAFDR